MSISEYEHHDVSTSEMSTSERQHREWLDNRCRSIGASEWSTLLNCGFAGQTRHTLYTQKVYPERVKELTGQHLFVGKLMEPSLARIAERASGRQVRYHRKPYVCTHREHKYLTATLDAQMKHEVHGWIPLELKSVSSFHGDEWAGGKAPIKYEVQLQAQMFCASRLHGCLFTVIDNTPTFRYRERDNELIAHALPRLEEFWNHVTKKDPPPIGEEDWWSEPTEAFLKAVYSTGTGAIIDLPGDAAEWHRKREKASESRRIWEQIYRDSSSRIRDAMKHATYGRVPGSSGAYSLRPNKSGTRTLRYHKTIKGEQNG